MKKFGLLTTLLIGGLLLSGCSFHVNVNDTSSTDENNETTSYSLNNDAGRLLACNDRVGFYLNTNTFNAEWGVEEEAGASFVLNGHVTREENGDIAEDDVECIIVKKSNGEQPQRINDYPENETAEIQADMPVAKMRVLEGQTEEETQAMVDEACSNMGGNWIDGGCVLEDGSIVNF